MQSFNFVDKKMEKEMEKTLPSHWQSLQATEVASKERERERERNVVGYDYQQLDNVPVARLPID